MDYLNFLESKDAKKMAKEYKVLVAKTTKPKENVSADEKLPHSPKPLK